MVEWENVVGGYRFGWNELKVTLSEFLLRGALFAIYRVVRKLPPFVRAVQWPEWHRYNFPVTVHERVSSLSLYLSVLGCWLGLGAVLGLVGYLFTVTSSTTGDAPNRRRAKCQSIASDQLKLFLAISLSWLLTAVISNLLKAWVGRPRPDFLSRCLPEGFDAADPVFSSLPMIPECTGDVDEVEEGRRSFPSGHSSYTFSVYVFAAFYLYNEVFVSFSEVLGGWRLSLSVFSVLPALYVAVSRTMDYRHHWDDVLSGAILGSVIAYLSWKLYFPSVKEDRILQVYGAGTHRRNSDALYQNSSFLQSPLCYSEVAPNNTRDWGTVGAVDVSDSSLPTYPAPIEKPTAKYRPAAAPIGRPSVRTTESSRTMTPVQGNFSPADTKVNVDSV